MLSIAKGKEKKINLQFSANDVSRVVICFEKEIEILDLKIRADEYSEDDIVESTDSKYYLAPVGIAIRNKKTIGDILEALSDKHVKSDGPSFNGILCYQVFLDKYNKILFVTKIVNDKGFVSSVNCVLKDGVIMFDHTRDDDISFRDYVFCRIIYNFMKENLSYVIDEQNGWYKDQGGLEKVLFKGCNKTSNKY
jgi:hypothetical protein